MSAIAESQASTGSNGVNVRAFLAGGGATMALIGAVVIAFLSVAALVAFNGLPIGGGNDDAGAAQVSELPSGAPEAAAAALARTPGAVADSPAAPTAIAPGVIPGLPGAPGGADGGAGVQGAVLGAPGSETPTVPGGGSQTVPGGGSASGPVGGVVGGVDEAAGNPGLDDVTGPITGPVDDTVNDTLNDVGGAVGQPNLGDQVGGAVNGVTNGLVGEGGVTDQLLGGN